MSNIHTPIDQELAKLLPNDEDIIFSTSVKRSLKTPSGTLKKWETPILITKSGFASYSKYDLKIKETRRGKKKLRWKSRKRKEGLRPEYVKWKELPRGKGLIKIPFVKRGFVWIAGRGVYFHFKVRNKKEREFSTYCRTLWEEYQQI
jgi:hypothetical protein